MKWVNKGMLNSYFPASDIFTFLQRSEALMNDSPSFCLPGVQEAPVYRRCFKGCHVAIVIDEIALARHTSLYLLIYLFKCSVCYCQGLFYSEYYFMPFWIRFLSVVGGRSPVTAKRITEEWGPCVFCSNSGLVKYDFCRSTVQSQPKIWLLFLP